MTDETGEVTFAQAYDPYGVVAQTAGDSQTVYGYTGEYTERLRRTLGLDGTSFHTYLAVDQAGFDKYMKPVLEDWSK